MRHHVDKGRMQEFVACSSYDVTSAFFVCWECGMWHLHHGPGIEALA